MADRSDSDTSTLFGTLRDTARRLLAERREQRWAFRVNRIDRDSSYWRSESALRELASRLWPELLYA